MDHKSDPTHLRQDKLPPAHNVSTLPKVSMPASDDHLHHAGSLADISADWPSWAEIWTVMSFQGGFNIEFSSQQYHAVGPSGRSGGGIYPAAQAFLD